MSRWIGRLLASSENQMVRSPCLRRPASYSGQLRIRYGDVACLYWLRFGYFSGGDSGSGHHYNDALKSGAMHQSQREVKHVWGASAQYFAAKSVLPIRSQPRTR